MAHRLLLDIQGFIVVVWKRYAKRLLFRLMTSFSLFFVNYAFKRFDRTIDIRINLFIIKTTLVFALLKINMVQVNNRPTKNDIRIRQLTRIFIIIYFIIYLFGHF